LLKVFFLIFILVQCMVLFYLRLDLHKNIIDVDNSQVQHQVAVLVPWLSAPSLPKHAWFYLKTVAESPLFHVLLLFENSSMILPDIQAKNIHYISIGKDGMATVLSKILHQGLGSDQTHTFQIIKGNLEKNPRIVTVYRPLYGSCFSEYITTGLGVILTL